ncbi:hypothetical protein CesoFtcFv8_026513 [Champsocephalus esox]|uniref:Uncharacterized protein n=1 Tax=Champsocephalus esox TaxID=159716 RepID=A0AAN8AZ97_9TELE|nr:hypothetical protein CesoFtcFv8_026513 [Champsocephalus esox]
MAVNVMLVPSVDYNRSKSEMLSAVVADKLTSASQEILVVVQRTVAGFEDEISALRSEISRQRHQLELLQPRITLCRPEEAVRVEAGGGEAPKEEKQTDVEDSDPFEEDEDRRDEEEPVLQQADAQTPELGDPGRKRRRRRAGRKRSEFVKLRVCLLGNTDSLRKGLLKSGVRELRCPPRSVGGGLPASSPFLVSTVTPPGGRHDGRPVSTSADPGAEESDARRNPEERRGGGEGEVSALPEREEVCK